MATLVIVIVPYITRMTSAAMVEALASDYVEMARLKGLPEAARRGRARPAQRHRAGRPGPRAHLPLPGRGDRGRGEYVFAYPGIGQSLVNAVTNRDMPVIQMIVLLLAAFYVLVNILADVVALLATPRRRSPR